jgi:hypothetical protein
MARPMIIFNYVPGQKNYKCFPLSHAKSNDLLHFTRNDVEGSIVIGAAIDIPEYYLVEIDYSKLIENSKTEYEISS